MLAALVIVFDYSLKFSGLKIPFPLLPYLRFDFTGVPIILSFLLFGTPSAAVTSGVAFLGIMARSGDVLGSSMKAIAEFSTVVGLALGFRFLRSDGKLRETTSSILGILSRCAVMLIVNVLVIPQTAALVTGSLLTGFNALQGVISLTIGYSLYQVTLRKMPYSVESRGSERKG